MEVFLFILLSNIIKYSISQSDNYCDLTKYCDSCTYCGEDTNDYCSCNFYNSYCLVSGTTKAYFSTNFILNYDGCLNNDKNLNLCGSSIVSFESGKTKTISFDSTSQTDFVCYYSITAKTNDNTITITINNEDNSEQNLDIYIITYQTDSSPVVTMISDYNLKSPVQIKKSNIEKISIYFDIVDGQNLDKLALSFLYNDISDQTTTVTKTKSSVKNNTGLIVGIILGIIALITIIIVGIYLYKRCKNKKVKNSSINNSNTFINDSTLTQQNIPIINNNKEKLNLLFKNELRPKIYNRNSTSNGCYNCTICMENFIENSSVIITTKCNHSFHEKCFKNWAFKNIISPKCPNCNDLILGPLDSNLQNMTLPSNIDYTFQTSPNGTTSNFGVTN